MGGNFDGVAARGVGSIQEGMTPTAERIGREITALLNRYAENDPTGEQTYAVLVGVAFAVANLALQMPAGVRWMFFQMITEQGHRLEHARRSAIVLNSPVGNKQP